MQTTDQQDELFTQVDAQDQVIGPVSRYEAHHHPEIIHRVSHIMVFDQEGRILLQKRSQTKDKYPGFWLDAAAGHVKFGDDYLKTAVRETAEEIGLQVSPNELIYLDKLFFANEDESEFAAYYKLQLLGQTPKLTKDPAEIEMMKFFTSAEIKKMLADPQVKFVLLTRMMLEKILR